MLHQATGDELVVLALRAPEPVTEAQMHRVAKRWFEAIGGTLLEERMDLEGTLDWETETELERLRDLETSAD